MKRKKLLLLQPENQEIHRFRNRQFNNFIQLTMPYLAAYVDPDQYDFTLIDEYNENIPYQRDFDLVAITVNTPNADHCYEIAARYRRQGAYVVLGGPHVTLLPREAAVHCDTVIAGEAEATWPQFLAGFSRGQTQRLYRADTPPQLAGLPSPRLDAVKHRNPLIKGAVIATRGCPHHCRYCNLKQIYTDVFRTRPVKEVAAEISRLQSPFFVFWDDNFFADHCYTKRLLTEMIPLKKHWAAQVTAADCLDAEILALARQAGCLYLFVGLESFSPASLREAGKDINRLYEYETVVQNLHQNKIMIQAGIVFGFDHDTRSVFDDTLAACERLGIDGATASLLTPFPQTPIYEQLERERRLLTTDWRCYNGKTDVVFQPKQMTAEELFRGYMHFRKQFYSLASFRKRMAVSKTHLFCNSIMHLGYGLAIDRRYFRR